MVWITIFNKIMTETDIYIKLFEKLKFQFVDEKCVGLSNILVYNGKINDRSAMAKIWFCPKSEIVSLIRVEDLQMGFGDRDVQSFNKQSINELYKQELREIKLNNFLDV